MTSVTIRSADRATVSRAVEEYLACLRAKHPEIVRAFWYGSWITGRPRPGSDVDLCLILSASDLSPRDRIPGYLPVGFPVGVDLVAYTEAEFERLRETAPSWHGTIVSGRSV